MGFWYRQRLTFAAWLLLPFSALFWIISTLRRFCYQKKILRSYRFPVPVIVVGNITVGGTGKTPLVIWLATFLTSRGFRPGIVSRGYGGQSQRTPCVVTPASHPEEVGDEAVLLALRSNVPVVVCVDRAAAVQALIADNHCDIVITDDGLQHYRLERDIEIAVVDAERGLGNRCLLPAGPLRETPSRLKEVDRVIYQGDGLPHRVSMQLFGQTLVALSDNSMRKPLSDFKGMTVHAVAGIGHPARFFAVLRHAGIFVIEHAFADHHRYRAKDFNFNDALPIIMTEKDAVKCLAFADKRFWHLPVDAVIDERFGVELLATLQRRERCAV